MPPLSFESGGIHPDGYEIIFIDDNGERLPDIPPPILSDSLFETENIQLQEDMPTQIWDIQTDQVEEKNVQILQSEVEEYELTNENPELATSLQKYLMPKNEDAKSIPPTEVGDL